MAPLASFGPVTAPFLMFLVLTLLAFSFSAAYPVPPRATNNARQATASAGLGRSMRTIPLMELLSSGRARRPESGDNRWEDRAPVTGRETPAPKSIPCVPLVGSTYGPGRERD